MQTEKQSAREEQIPQEKHDLEVRPLKGYNAFDAVFRYGSRFAYHGVTAFILFHDTLTPDILSQEPALARILEVQKTLQRPCIFVGVSAKRRTRPAIMRNRIKRLLRTSIRTVITSEQEPCAGIAAMVLICNIIPSKPSLLMLDDLLPLVRRIVQNAAKHLRSRRETEDNNNTART